MKYALTFRLPEPPKREPDEMTSYDHLSQARWQRLSAH